MDTNQMLWAVNSLLIVLLGFFIKNWMTKLEEAIAKKTDKEMCQKVHDGIQKHLHFHSSAGSAGEVVQL